MKNTLCFASRNKGKIAEIQKILVPHFQVIGLEDIHCHEELPETTDTIAGNSAQKAQFVWDNYQVNCFADDSGLEIVALEGEPGVHSAYYAGLPKNDAENIALVLAKMQQNTDRKAQFKTVISLILEGEMYQFEGIIQGDITLAPKGLMGFGYDPIFIPKGATHTFAEMDMEMKNQMSHRSQALKKMHQFLLMT